MLSGSGTDRTVGVTPATNQVGSAAVTLSLNDGTTITSARFTVTVTAPGPLPSDLVAYFQPAAEKTGTALRAALHVPNPDLCS